MKKILLYALISVLLLNLLQPVTVSASEINTETEYFENGDYLVTTIVTYPQSRSNSGSVRADKTTTYNNASGDVLWSLTVTGTFFYVYGVSCTCTAASGSAASYSSSWKVSEPTTAYSGNTARCSVSATHYFSIIPLNTVNATVALACDTYGNLS